MDDTIFFGCNFAQIKHIINVVELHDVRKGTFLMSV